jgi:tetratricopeptide (TPR) repeat protein
MPRLASIITLCIVALTTFVMLGGCTGPTKKGNEARSAAAERVHMMNAQLSFDQARRSFETGDLDRALREVNQALGRYDSVPEYHVLKGRILLEQHRLEQALASFNEAAELAGGELSALGDPFSASGEELSALGHQPSADSRQPTATRSGQPIATGNPLAAEAHYFAGIIFQRWSNHERSFERYFAAARLDQTNVQYLLAAAEALIALGRYDDARHLVTGRLAYHEHNAALRHLLAHVASLNDDAAAAATLLREARLLNPDDLTLLEELARAQYRAEQYGPALDSIHELYRQGVSAAGGRDDLRLLEARTLVRLERYIEARRVYLELSRNMSGDPDIWIELGAVALEVGDDRRVAQAATQTITLAPDRHEGYVLRAAYEFEQGKVSQAERLLGDALQRSPDNALTHLMLGRLLEDRGEVQLAIEHYRAALAMQPHSPEAARLLSRITASTEVTAVTDRD